MEVVKKTDDFTVFKKRSGRYGVKRSNGKWVNGPDKTKILVDLGLVKQSVKAAPVEEPTADESASEE